MNDEDHAATYRCSGGVICTMLHHACCSKSDRGACLSHLAAE